MEYEGLIEYVMSKLKQKKERLSSKAEYKT